MYRFRGITNQIRSVLRCLRGFSCQIADLLRHNGKSLAGGSCSRRLHCRVQCQNIRLEGDVVYGLENLFNLLGACLNPFHRFYQTLHLLVTHKHFLAGLARLGTDIQRTVCRVCHLFGNHANPRRKLLHRTCLLRSALTERLGACRQLVTCLRHLTRGMVDLPHGIAE